MGRKGRKMKKFLKNYWFILSMLAAIVGGCLTGFFWEGATCLEPLGTLFINMMFCVVVPMVFVSTASAVANMKSVRRSGSVIGTTILTFFVTALIAAVFMYLVTLVIPVTSGASVDAGEVEAASGLSVGELVINFFTKPDFTELFSRKAILPLIVAAIFFGYGIQMAGGPENKVAQFLSSLNECLMNVVKIISYYAPIGFFGFFAYLVATYGPGLIGNYSRTLITYYVICFVYMLIFFPLYARFGGGKNGVRELFRHVFRPAVTAFGTCSSVATIPTNMKAAEETGIPKEVSDIVLPLGSSMHMDGSAMSAVIKVAFLFGMFGQDFTTGRAILAIIVAVLASVSMGGIPGGGGTSEMVLCTVFFPEQMAIAAPIAIALGNLVDPAATMVNSAGDYAASFIVARFTSGKDWLDKAVAARKEKKDSANGEEK